MRVRGFFYKHKFKHYGSGAFFKEDTKIFFPQNISIGERTGVNTDCWINASGGLKIGCDVNIGPHTIIHTANHVFSDPEKPIMSQGHTMKPVHIEDDVWIGAGVIILPGVTVGHGSVIGAGSIVTKDIAACSVAVGNPARVKRRR